MSSRGRRGARARGRARLVPVAVRLSARGRTPSEAISSLPKLVGSCLLFLLVGLPRSSPRAQVRCAHWPRCPVFGHGTAWAWAWAWARLQGKLRPGDRRLGQRRCRRRPRAPSPARRWRKTSGGSRAAVSAWRSRRVPGGAEASNAAFRIRRTGRRSRRGAPPNSTWPAVRGARKSCHESRQRLSHRPGHRGFGVLRVGCERRYARERGPEEPRTAAVRARAASCRRSGDHLTRSWQRKRPGAKFGSRAPNERISEVPQPGPRRPSR